MTGAPTNSPRGSGVHPSRRKGGAGTNSGATSASTGGNEPALAAPVVTRLAPAAARVAAPAATPTATTPRAAEIIRIRSPAAIRSPAIPGPIGMGHASLRWRPGRGRRFDRACCGRRGGACCGGTGRVHRWRLPPVTAPSAPRPPAPSCLNKTYLQAGVVMFRDVCSQEWAINSSSVTNPAPTNSACLSKENPQDGVVLFKDNCTSEWAMNPQRGNQAQN